MLIITVEQLRFKIESKEIVPQLPWKLQGTLQPNFSHKHKYTYVMDAIYQLWISRASSEPLEYFNLKDGLDIIEERSMLMSLNIFEILPDHLKKALGAQNEA